MEVTSMYIYITRAGEMVPQKLKKMLKRWSRHTVDGNAYEHMSIILQPDKGALKLTYMYVLINSRVWLYYYKEIMQIEIKTRTAEYHDLETLTTWIRKPQQASEELPNRWKKSAPSFEILERHSTSSTLL